MNLSPDHQNFLSKYETFKLRGRESNVTRLSFVHVQNPQFLATNLLDTEDATYNWRLTRNRSVSTLPYVPGADPSRVNALVCPAQTW